MCEMAMDTIFINHSTYLEMLHKVWKVNLKDKKDFGFSVFLEVAQNLSKCQEILNSHPPPVWHLVELRSPIYECVCLQVVCLSIYVYLCLCVCFSF